MRLIYISAIITVLTTFIGMSWLIDQIADLPDNKHPYAEDEQHRITHILVKEYLNATEKERHQETLTRLNATLPYEFSFAGKAEFSIPDEFQALISSPKGVMLTSSEKPFIISESGITGGYYLVQKILTVGDTGIEDLLLTTLLYLSISFVLVLWVAPLTRRISLLSATVADFGSGNLSQRISIPRWSYTKKLENRFNQMAEQIEQLIADNKLLVDSLSHDLKTPLTCIRFGLDAALKADATQQNQQYLSRVDSELECMERMLDAFLDYASMSRKKQSLIKTEIELNSMVDSVLENLEPLFTKNEMVLQVSYHKPEVLIYADQHWLERSVVNLVSNAISYGRKHVKVSTVLTGRILILQVDDDGKGIPEDKQKTVFDPFSRLEQSRNRTTAHYGLGLAIVKKVAQWHDANISVEKSDLGGARFKLEMLLDQIK